MLNEAQIRSMITECEVSTGSKLEKLRHELLVDHEESLAHLWELVVLHASLSIGKIEHEPEQGSPDIHITTKAGRKIFLEAAFIHPRKSVSDVPQEVKDSPVYRKIQDKAKQAKKWKKSQARKYFPLILILGAKDDVRIDPSRMNGISAEQAIYAALTRTEMLDMNTCSNLIGHWATHDAFKGTRKRFRVKSSELISGVVFAKFTRAPTLLEYDIDEINSVGDMICEAQYYKNLHPAQVIDNNLLEEMEAFDLNKYVYTSLNKAWEFRDKGDLIKRARIRGGSMSISYLGNQGFELEIPAVLCTQLLAGSITSDEAWNRYQGSAIGEKIKNALAKGQEIIEAEIINPKDESKEPMIRLKFGSPKFPVIRGTKRPRH